MRRLWMAAVLGTVALGATAGPAAALTWKPVDGVIRGEPIAARRDGSGALVASLQPGLIRLTRVARGRVGPSQTLPTGRHRRNAQLLVSPSGRAVVVWSGPGGIRASVRASRGGRFAPSRVISVQPGGAGRSNAAVAPDGRVLVAWLGDPLGGRIGIHASELGLTGSWSAPVEVSGAPPRANGRFSAAPIRALAAPDGGWSVAWGEFEQPRGGSSYLVASATRGGDWGSPVTLVPGASGTLPTPSVTAQRNEIVAVSADVAPPFGTGCATAILLSVVGLSQRTLACSAADAGVAIAPLTTGGTLIAWNPRNSVYLFARAPGSPEWIPAPSPAVARFGPVAIASFSALPAARALLVARLLPAPVGTLYARRPPIVRAVLVAADGRPVSRADAPPTPGRTRFSDVRFLPLDAPRAGGALLWQLPGPSRYRLSLLVA